MIEHEEDLIEIDAVDLFKRVQTLERQVAALIEAATKRGWREFKHDDVRQIEIGQRTGERTL